MASRGPTPTLPTQSGPRASQPAPIGSQKPPESSQPQQTSTTPSSPPSNPLEAAARDPEVCSILSSLAGAFRAHTAKRNHPAASPDVTQPETTREPTTLLEAQLGPRAIRLASESIRAEATTFRGLDKDLLLKALCIWLVDPPVYMRQRGAEEWVHGSTYGTDARFRNLIREEAMQWGVLMTNAIVVDQEISPEDMLRQIAHFAVTAPPKSFPIHLSSSPLPSPPSPDGGAKAGNVDDGLSSSVFSSWKIDPWAVVMRLIPIMSQNPALDSYYAKTTDPATGVSPVAHWWTMDSSLILNIIEAAIRTVIFSLPLEDPVVKDAVTRATRLANARTENADPRSVCSYLTAGPNFQKAKDPGKVIIATSTCTAIAKMAQAVIPLSSLWQNPHHVGIRLVLTAVTGPNEAHDPTTAFPDSGLKWHHLTELGLPSILHPYASHVRSMLVEVCQFFSPVLPPAIPTVGGGSNPPASIYSSSKGLFPGVAHFFFAQTSTFPNPTPLYGDVHRILFASLLQRRAPLRLYHALVDPIDRHRIQASTAAAAEAVSKAPNGPRARTHKVVVPRSTMLLEDSFIHHLCSLASLDLDSKEGAEGAIARPWLALAEKLYALVNNGLIDYGRLVVKVVAAASSTSPELVNNYVVWCLTQCIPLAAVTMTLSDPEASYQVFHGLLSLYDEDEADKVSLPLRDTSIISLMHRYSTVPTAARAATFGLRSLPGAPSDNVSLFDLINNYQGKQKRLEQLSAAWAEQKDTPGFATMPSRRKAVVGIFSNSHTAGVATSLINYLTTNGPGDEPAQLGTLTIDAPVASPYLSFDFSFLSVHCRNRVLENLEQYLLGAIEACLRSPLQNRNRVLSLVGEAFTTSLYSQAARPHQAVMFTPPALLETYVLCMLSLPHSIQRSRLMSIVLETIPQQQDPTKRDSNQLDKAAFQHLFAVTEAATYRLLPLLTDIGAGPLMGSMLWTMATHSDTAIASLTHLYRVRQVLAIKLALSVPLGGTTGPVRPDDGMVEFAAKLEDMITKAEAGEQDGVLDWLSPQMCSILHTGIMWSLRCQGASSDSGRAVLTKIASGLRRYMGHGVSPRAASLFPPGSINDGAVSPPTSPRSAARAENVSSVFGLNLEDSNMANDLATTAAPSVVSGPSVASATPAPPPPSTASSQQRPRVRRPKLKWTKTDTSDALRTAWRVSQEQGGSSNPLPPAVRTPFQAASPSRMDVAVDELVYDLLNENVHGVAGGFGAGSSVPHGQVLRSLVWDQGIIPFESITLSLGNHLANSCGCPNRGTAGHSTVVLELLAAVLFGDAQVDLTNLSDASAPLPPPNSGLILPVARWLRLGLNPLPGRDRDAALRQAQYFEVREPCLANSWCPRIYDCIPRRALPILDIMLLRMAEGEAWELLLRTLHTFAPLYAYHDRLLSFVVAFNAYTAHDGPDGTPFIPPVVRVHIITTLLSVIPGSKIAPLPASLSDLSSGPHQSESTATGQDSEEPATKRARVGENGASVPGGGAAAATSAQPQRESSSGFDRKLRLDPGWAALATSQGPIERSVLQGLVSSIVANITNLLNYHDVFSGWVDGSPSTDIQPLQDLPPVVDDAVAIGQLQLAALSAVSNKHAEDVFHAITSLVVRATTQDSPRLAVLHALAYLTGSGSGALGRQSRRRELWVAVTSLFNETIRPLISAVLDSGAVFHGSGVLGLAVGGYGKMLDDPPNLRDILTPVASPARCFPIWLASTTSLLAVDVGPTTLFQDALGAMSSMRPLTSLTELAWGTAMLGPVLSDAVKRMEPAFRRKEATSSIGNLVVFGMKLMLEDLGVACETAACLRVSPQSGKVFASAVNRWEWSRGTGSQNLLCMVLNFTNVFSRILDPVRFPADREAVESLHAIAAEWRPRYPFFIGLVQRLVLDGLHTSTN